MNYVHLVSYIINTQIPADDSDWLLVNIGLVICIHSSPARAMKGLDKVRSDLGWSLFVIVFSEIKTTA
jgi:hypothetical protein